MVKKTSGTCNIPLTEEECRKGPYPDSSYEWERVEKFSSEPSGCYVWLDSLVYYNKHPSGSNCDESESCLCKPGIPFILLDTYDMANVFFSVGCN